MKKCLLLTLTVLMLLPLMVFASGRQMSRSEIKKKVEDLLDYDIELLQMALEIKMVQKYKGSIVVSYNSITKESTFIGRIENQFSSDSIFNEVGRYGSEVSSTSIWNEVGRYGSEVSSCSSFNEIASNPPIIIKNDQIIGRLTVNKIISDGINPYLLRLFFVD